MARLRNRNESPPGGFVVDVPQTSYHATLWAFDAAARALHNHLAANPGIHKRFPGLPKTIAECETYVDRHNAERCLKIRGAESYVLSGAPPSSPPKSEPPGTLARYLGAAAEHAANTAGGARLLIDWLGSGLIPVESELSAQRALVCAGCPQNKDGDFWQRLDAIAAQQVRFLVSKKNELKLATPVDAKLKTCQACDCYLPLKVHAPLKHILAHLTLPQRAKLWGGCWILAEEKARK